MDVREPEIQKDNTLKLQDSNFNTTNVCIVTGCGSGAIGNMTSLQTRVCIANKPVYSITTFGIRALTQSMSAERADKIRSLYVSTCFTKIPLALNQVPAQRQSGEGLQLSKWLQR